MTNPRLCAHSQYRQGQNPKESALQVRFQMDTGHSVTLSRSSDSDHPKRTSGRRHIIGALGSAMALLSQAAQLTLGVALAPRSTTVGPPPGYARR